MKSDHFQLSGQETHIDTFYEGLKVILSHIDKNNIWDINTIYEGLKAYSPAYFIFVSGVNYSPIN